MIDGSVSIMIQYRDWFLPDFCRLPCSENQSVLSAMKSWGKLGDVKILTSINKINLLPGTGISREDTDGTHIEIPLAFSLLHCLDLIFVMVSEVFFPMNGGISKLVTDGKLFGFQLLKTLLCLPTSEMCTLFTWLITDLCNHFVCSKSNFHHGSWRLTSEIWNVS